MMQAPDYTSFDMHHNRENLLKLLPTFDTCHFSYFIGQKGHMTMPNFQVAGDIQLYSEHSKKRIEKLKLLITLHHPLNITTQGRNSSMIMVTSPASVNFSAPEIFEHW